MNCTITSDGTQHRAWNTANGAGELWRVSWAPEKPLTHEQAVTAMQIAELLGTGYASPINGIVQLPDWAAELNMTAAEVFQHVADRRAWGCAVRYADLPWQHKALLLLLGTFFDTDGVYRQPTTAELAKTTGLAEQHIVDLLVELENERWFCWHAVTGADINTTQPERLLVLDPAHAGQPPA